MYYTETGVFDILSWFFYLLLVGLFVLLVVVGVRFLLAATRALNAITEERALRLALLLADDEEGGGAAEPKVPEAP
jgi:hypothetical protein